MERHTRAARRAGVVLGILYVLQAIFRPSSLFLLWPLIGGVLATYSVVRQHGQIRAREGAAAGARAATLGGAILLVIGVPAAYAVMHVTSPDPLEAEMGRWFRSVPLDIFLLIAVVAVAYALAGLVLASAGGAVASFVFRKAASSDRSSAA